VRRDYFDLTGDSMRWEIGVKEVWKVPKRSIGSSTR